jgi:predicted TPR repeat methyltransferase
VNDRENLKERFIVERFDSLAESFDDPMARTKYNCARLLFAEMDEILKDSPSKHAILDVGCGTGLCGVLFSPLARVLDGVDISSGMLSKARERRIYDTLAESELLSYLNESSSTYDLVIAGGVLGYLSNVEDVFKGVNRVLRNGGYFAFTSDKLEEGLVKFAPSPEVALEDTERGVGFCHNPNYIREAAETANFEFIKIDQIVDRNAWVEETPMTAMLYVLRKG